MPYDSAEENKEERRLEPAAELAIRQFLDRRFTVRRTVIGSSAALILAIASFLGIDSLVKNASHAAVDLRVEELVRQKLISERNEMDRTKADMAATTRQAAQELDLIKK